MPNVKERINTTTLRNALNNNLLEDLKNCKKIDVYTQLHIKGCAVGKDEALLNLMKQAFGGRLKVFMLIIYLDLIAATVHKRTSIAFR